MKKRSRSEQARLSRLNCSTRAIKALQLAINYANYFRDWKRARKIPDKDLEISNEQTTAEFHHGA